MKNRSMRGAVVSQIYNQRLTYEYHIKKLQRIRQQRKTQLAFNHNRISYLQNIRDSKSRSFVLKFNQHNNQISKSNIKMLHKLEKVKPFSRHTSYSVTDKNDKQQPSSIIRPYMRKLAIQTQKENSRIYIKMKSMSSSLNKDRLLSEYAKSQQIKSRIAKYSTLNNKIQLKSQKFLNQNNNSFITNKAATQRRNLPHQQQVKKNLVSYYNKDDILRNKIINPHSELLKLRKNKLLGKVANKQYAQAQNKQSFFATQPTKNVPQYRQKNQKRMHV